MSDNDWFYLYGDKQQGPISETALIARIVKGELSRDVPLWRTGREGWHPAAHIPELASLIPPPVPLSHKEPPWYKAGLGSPNKAATLALWLAGGSVLFYEIGMIPLAAVGVSIYALFKAREMNGVGRGRAVTALVVSVIYTLMYLGHYGHLGGRH
jgi:hypothetical protein